MQDSKKPERAKIVAQEFGTFKDNKNAYVLFVNKEDALKAKETLNQIIFEGHHLRVDLADSTNTDGEKGRNKASEDFTKSIFVGNLPFIASEEDVRAHFSICGKIENVRLVRDPKTYLGKGIGYVMFSTKEEMRAAIDQLHAKKFKDRELRVKMATEPKKRDKKKQRKEEAQEERRKRRLAKQGKNDEDEEELKKLPRGIIEVSSDDSEDEKPAKQKLPPVVSLEGSNFGKRNPDDDQEIQLHNSIAFNRRKKQKMLKEMISNSTKIGKTSQQRQADKELFS